jgi:nucleotide-binding universal stress UspA family protein
MQTIITPTDFSDASLNAVNYAADMAMATQANLLILHAIEMPLSAGRVYEEPNKIEIDAEIKLNALKQNLMKSRAGKISIQTKQVVGLIESEIIKMCTYKNPLAIVMATKGASIKSHFFMESITVYLAKNLKYPVIVVPPKTVYKPINKILLATDLENLYSIPIEKIKNIVNVFKAKLDIVYIYNKEDNGEVMISRMTELVNYLHSLNPQFYFIYNRDVYKGIIDFAKENKSDMILTLPKEHAFFHKSESKQLIFNAPFAVMTM